MNLGQYDTGGFLGEMLQDTVGEDLVEARIGKWQEASVRHYV